MWWKWRWKYHEIAVRDYRENTVKYTVMMVRRWKYGESAVKVISVFFTVFTVVHTYGDRTLIVTVTVTIMITVTVTVFSYTTLYEIIYSINFCAPHPPKPHPTLLVDVLCECFQIELLKGGGRVEYGQLKALSILQGKIYIIIHL